MLRKIGTDVPNAALITFDDFWLLYPRKVAKKNARKAWDQIPVDKHDEIIKAEKAWHEIWLKEDEHFLPYPASWLNGERWEDEIPDRRKVQEKRKGLNERRAETIQGLTGETDKPIDGTAERLD